jgi:hypothetical protein
MTGFREFDVLKVDFLKADVVIYIEMHAAGCVLQLRGPKVKSFQHLNVVLSSHSICGVCQAPQKLV